MQGRGRLRVVFMGTPEFAVPSLKALIASEDVVAVITKPDRPKGRGMIFSSPPVKQFAVEHGISCLQPESIKDEGFIKKIKDLNPDIIIVISYGKILPKRLLNIPPHGCINVHASLLPKYRGAAPINWALINGEKETGITIIQMDEGMDTGAILLQKGIAIEEDDNAESLYKKLSLLGACCLLKTLNLLKSEALKPEPQDNSSASYAPLLKKEDGLISWTNDANRIRNFLRGMNPWPGAYTFWRGKRLKILKAMTIDIDTEGRPGVIREVSTYGIDVITGKGLLRVTELQLEGRRVMEVGEFIQGHKLKKGERLG